MRSRIYTDGSCIGNPGRGGYGVAVYKAIDVSPVPTNNRGGAAERARWVNCFNVSEEEPHTTNNRMEMMAMIVALEIARELQVEFDIYSDSTYTIKGLTEWMAGWKRKGWKTAGWKRKGGKTVGKKDVLNRDLWERMDSAYESVRGLVSIHKVKAHCGIEGNELADTLARPRS